MKKIPIIKHSIKYHADSSVCLTQYLIPATMKKTILLLSIICLTSILSGQELRVSVAPTFSKVYQFKYVQGTPYGAAGFGYVGNIDYSFVTNRKVEFGIGLGYHISQVLIWIPIMSDFTADHERIDLFSVSLKSKFKLPKEFYMSLDPSLDFQVNYNRLHVADNQSGLGMSFGIGRNFRLNDGLLLNIEPRLWFHNLIPFHELESPFRLATTGINFGLVFGHMFTK